MQRRFVGFAWFVVIYNLGVILWGAFVRATGSGAGCGSHWPLCNGEVIPRAPQVETMIEFTHRITSGVAGLLVIAMVVWAVRAFPKGHLARRGAWLSLVVIIIEGLLGAGLVLLGLVADNSSWARAVAMGVHLMNTLLLLGVLVLTAWWGNGGGKLRWRGQGMVSWLLFGGVAGMMVLGATGAITALGDTLFPAESLRHGLAQDLDPQAHFLIQLRVWHPVLAIALGIYLLLAGRVVYRMRPQPATQRAATVLLLLFCSQLAIGAVNLVLLAPVAMQLIHLLMADLTWIALVWLCASALSQPQPTAVPVPERARSYA
ncbi:MAG: COX15/CtaA family protein [Chloroflexaceae bacterium]|jgi:heme A synthase|nr:COX15/CtaA family protein [Chloroflexaceae bacterium]